MTDRPQLVVGLNANLCPHLVASLDQLPSFARTLEGWGVDQIAVGDRIVTGEGIAPYSLQLRSTMSRKGEPGIVAQAGTAATITKLRARHLR